MNNIVVQNQIKSLQKIGLSLIEQFSDKELYEYCRTTGLSARIWARKFIAVIPEVARRHLYLKHKCRSIHEFASKLAGLSHKTVNEVLRIYEKFKEFPKMKELIGDVGISKLKVVACIVTSKSEPFWAKKVIDMSRPALEVFVRDIRKQEEEKIIRQQKDEKNGLNFGKNINEIESFAEQKNDSSMCQKFPWEPGSDEVKQAKECTQDSMVIFRKEHTNEQTGMFEKDFNDPGIVDDRFSMKNKKAFLVHIDDDTEFKLRKFKLNLEKEKKQVLDWNKTLKELLSRVF